MSHVFSWLAIVVMASFCSQVLLEQEVPANEKARLATSANFKGDQEPASKVKRKFEDVEFMTSDDIKISASYRLPDASGVKGGGSPAIILIHQGGSSREEWLRMPLVKELVKEGYVVLAYDVRQHGKSAADKGSRSDLFGNPQRAPLDLMAAIAFLKQHQKVDAKRIGIMGASIGANLACVASSQQKYGVKSVVSISSKTSAVKSLSGEKELQAPVNAFHIASADEQNGMRAKWAKELHGKTEGRRKVEIASGNKHGSYILAEHPKLRAQVVAWFKETLSAEAEGGSTK